MAEIIGKEFLKLALVHLADGSSHILDPNGNLFALTSLNKTNLQIEWDQKLFWADAHESEEIIRPLPPGKVLVYSLISAALILFAGLTSGLNLSLLSIAPLKIKIMEMSSKPYERKVVKRIKPVLKNQHFLLVTLLVANSAAMESLPIFLDRMVSSWLAIVISVTFVLIFGEILPQALLASDPLKAGYYFAWLVRLLQYLTFPVTYPLSLLLDRIVKHERGTVFTHEEMTNLFGIISQDKETRTEFHKDELLFLDGALKLRTLTVEREMVRWKHVKSFPYDLELDEKGLAKIWECGFSRVPVYKEHEMDIIGICLIKDLILVDPNPKPLLGHYVRRKPVIMSPSTTMIQALNLFREKRTHFALVTEQVDTVNDCLRAGKVMPKSVKFLGAITLEDIMEQLIQEEIEDEYDSSFDAKGVSALEEQRLISSQIFHRKDALSQNQKAVLREKKIEAKQRQLQHHLNTSVELAKTTVTIDSGSSSNKVQVTKKRTDSLSFSSKEDLIGNGDEN